MELTLFSGSANPSLAQAVARGLGTPLGACAAEHFPDGELHLELRESVRGHDVYLMQPTCPPVADHLLELMRGRTPLIVDDMISTGHTLATAVRGLLAAGCQPDITVVVSHGLFVGPIERVLVDLPISKVMTTDSVPPRGDLPLPVEVTTLAPLLVEAIRRLHHDESLSDLVVHR